MKSTMPSTSPNTIETAMPYLPKKSSSGSALFGAVPAGAVTAGASAKGAVAQVVGCAGASAEGFAAARASTCTSPCAARCALF